MLPKPQKNLVSPGKETKDNINLQSETNWVPNLLATRGKEE